MQIKNIKVKYPILGFFLSLVVYEIFSKSTGRGWTNIEVNNAASYFLIIRDILIYTCIAPFFEEISSRLWLKRGSAWLQSIALGCFIIDLIISISAIIGIWNLDYYEQVRFNFVTGNPINLYLQSFRSHLGLLREYLVLFFTGLLLSPLIHLVCFGLKKLKHKLKFSLESRQFLPSLLISSLSFSLIYFKPDRDSFVSMLPFLVFVFFNALCIGIVRIKINFQSAVLMHIIWNSFYFLLGKIETPSISNLYTVYTVIASVLVTSLYFLILNLKILNQTTLFRPQQ